MKKKLSDRGQHIPLKVLLGIKLFLCLFLAATINASAASYVQSKQISLNLKKATLTEVFSAIEKQSDFTFFFKSGNSELNKKVDIQAADKKISEILNQVLVGTNLTYTVKDKVIVILSKEDQKAAGGSTQKNDLINIKGKVTSAAGVSLPGVSIKVKGKSQGASTDGSGSYTLTSVPQGAILQFSFIGMEPQEVSVAGKNQIDVILQEKSVSVKELVVVGYGTTTKAKLVSSVSSIETKTISKVPYTSAVNGLAGRTSGLFIREQGGQYGSLPSISIRGAGEPAIYIDGIKSSKAVFAMIPPSDIEDISVLKDASAAAVYGFDSANGVVLVTTKKASKGKMAIQVSSDYSLQSNPLRPKFMTPYQKALFDNQCAFNDGQSQIINDATLNILKNNLDPVKNPTYVPYDMAIKKRSVQQRHSLTISGSEGNTDTYVSADWFNQEAIYKLGNNGLDRYSIRFNMSHKFDNLGLTASAGVSLYRELSKYPPADQWLLWITTLRCRPGLPLFNPSGNYYGEANALAMQDPAAGYAKYETNRAIGNITFKWDVPWVKGLVLKAVSQYETTHNFNKIWSTSFRTAAPIYSWDNKLMDMGLPTLNESTGRTNRYTMEGHVNYQKTIAETHNIEVTGVVIKAEDRWDGFSAYRKDFISPAVDQMFAGNPNGQQTDGSASESGRLGYVGRLKYDYNQKYILEASCRYDGNDNFPSEKRYGFFPSISLGWNVGEEALIRPWMDRISMNSLKLRASIGTLGSSGGVDRFGYIPVYNLNNSNYYINGEWKGTYTEGPLVSRNLGWYKVQNRNFGFDFAFLKNTISGTIDWFYYRTTGFIGSPTSTYTTPLGKDLPKINTNSALRRGGFEASLAYHGSYNGLQLNLGGNISYYDQLWETKYDESEVNLMNPYTRQTHQKDYYTIGYNDLGYYQTIDEIINSPRFTGANKTYRGDLRYEDTNGDGKIDDNDKRRIGKSDFPHFTYGATLNASYKGFTFDALIQGTSNRQAYLTPTQWYDGTNSRAYTITNNYWREDNHDALFPRMSTELYWVNGSNNIQTSTFWLKDAWYVRLKSLSLSYDLKYSILKKVKFVNSCALIMSGTNLFTISPITDFLMDPEVTDFGATSYPVPRTVNFGLRVAF